jgi:hypothetical protein
MSRLRSEHTPRLYRNKPALAPLVPARNGNANSERTTIGSDFRRATALRAMRRSSRVQVPMIQSLRWSGSSSDERTLAAARA